MKSILKAGLLVLAFSLPAFSAQAAGGKGTLLGHEFSFQGPFGTYDQAQLQRGLQVYREVCAACHGLKFVSFRTLADPKGPGMSDDAVKAIAAEYEVQDEAGEPGDTRAAKAFDYFPTPIASGNPPDMSLLAKARSGGADHIYSVLMGYTGEEKEEAGALLYYNTAMGGYFGMGQPIDDGYVTYADGSPETLAQYSEDVSAFLMWAAEPKLVERKQAGVWSMAFLALFAVLMWFTNKKVWRKIKHPH